jgi:predicted DNA-binding antitoxin AbrB/MazE fold protein
MTIEAIYYKGVIKPLETLDLKENEKIEIEIKRGEGNISEVMRFAGIWKNMPEEKIKVFSGILKERETFNKGRISLG